MTFKPNYDGSRIGQFYLAGGTVETIALYDEIKKQELEMKNVLIFGITKKII